MLCAHARAHYTRPLIVRLTRRSIQFTSLPAPIPDAILFPILTFTVDVFIDYTSQKQTCLHSVSFTAQLSVYWSPTTAMWNPFKIYLRLHLSPHELDIFSVNNSLFYWSSTSLYLSPSLSHSNPDFLFLFFLAGEELSLEFIFLNIRDRNTSSNTFLFFIIQICYLFVKLKIFL